MQIMSSKLFWIFLLSLTVGAFAQSENATEKTDSRNAKGNSRHLTFSCPITGVLSSICVILKLLF